MFIHYNSGLIINVIWTVTAASPLSVTALRIITGCNQQDVYWSCRHPTLRHSEASLCWPLLEIEPSSIPDKKHDDEHNFPSQFCFAQLAASSYLPEVLLPCFSALPRPLHRFTLLWLSQTEQAVQLLLETGTDKPSYYRESLKACMLRHHHLHVPWKATKKILALI